MPRGTKRADAKAERARQVLIETITKILDLEPTLGGKWRDGMLNYYISRLAELVLYQSGFNHPTRTSMAPIEANIRACLDIEST